MTLNTHRAPRSRRSRNLVLGGAVALAVAGASLLGVMNANAAVPTPEAGNVVLVAAAPRIVGGSGMQLTGTTTIQVAGQTFGSTTVPANATGVTVNITSISPSAAGKLTVWTTDAGQPGSPTVSFKAGEQQTNSVTVALNSAGKLSVNSNVSTKFVMALLGYVTPVAAPVPPSVKNIAPVVGKTLEHIGVSVKTECDCAGNGVTDLGSVSLEPGTYDVKVIGGFSGIKASAVLPANTSIFAGLFITNGAGVTAEFANVITQNQGVLIPRSVNDATVTIDPTATLFDTIKIDETTEVHLSAYGYANDGVDHSALGVKANVRTASFTKVG